MRITVTDQAAREIVAIGRYLADFSPHASRKLLRRIDDAIYVMLATHPLIGSPRDDVSPGLRTVIVAKYIICYRVMADEIVIVRVFHGAQDLSRQF